MIRYYIVPSIGSGSSHLDAVRPKYFGIGELYQATLIGSLDSMAEGIFFVIADVDPIQEAAISLLVDVAEFNTNLALIVDLTFTNKLNGFGLPTSFITLSTTYQEAMELISRLFIFHQRLYTINGIIKLFTSVNLDNDVSTLSVSIKNNMIQAANDVGADGSVIFDGKTIEQALIDISNSIDKNIFVAGNLVNVATPTGGVDDDVSPLSNLTK